MSIFSKINTSPLEEGNEPVVEPVVEPENDDVNPIGGEGIVEPEPVVEDDPDDQNAGSNVEEVGNNATEDPDDEEFKADPEEYILPQFPEFPYSNKSEVEIPEEYKDDPALKLIEQMIEAKVAERTADIRQKQEQDVLESKLSAVAREFPALRESQNVNKLAQKAFEIARDLGNPQLAKNPSPRLLKMAAQELFGDTKARVYEKGRADGASKANGSAIKDSLNPVSTGAALGKEPQKGPEDLLAEMIVNAGKGSGIFKRK